ncbi:TerD family protein [Actinomadura sp. HBU206391]|uniref:TerD family protein n=1 Tax=Actinomadura sp. HBU206391 TaxID=2731692 RepID=UPI001C9D2E26|nr:TerD family protein [Actinomadura sp. HBU206391]
MGRFARADRAAARQRAEQDAAAYLAAEQARLHQMHQQLTADADEWWQELIGNDQDTVCEVVNAAFSDNPVAGCAVGVEGTVLSVLMRQYDLDTLPHQTPGLTPGGQPTLKKLSGHDRVLWWLTMMGSNVIATLKEAFATAPGIRAIDLAVLTRMPDTQRLGIVAYGRWTRDAIESARWQEPQDALRFLDVGQDVACSVSTTSSVDLSTSVKPLDIDRQPGLRALLDNAQDVPGTEEPSVNEVEAGPAVAVPVRTRMQGDPYQVRPFAHWKQETAPAPPPPQSPRPARPAQGSAHPAPRHEPPVLLAPGQTLVLPEDAYQGLVVAFTSAGADADLTLLLTGADGRVTGDEDFVFYHQPTAAHGAARLVGKKTEGPGSVERATIHLSALPTHVQRVVVSINMDVDTELTCGALTHASLQIKCATGETWQFEPPTDPSISAMITTELYRHTVNGHPVWKLRAVGQGWAGGLNELARAHGVNVE